VYLNLPYINMVQPKDDNFTMLSSMSFFLNWRQLVTL